jgi:hypothetical protein
MSFIRGDINDNTLFGFTPGIFSSASVMRLTLPKDHERMAGRYLGVDIQQQLQSTDEDAKDKRNAQYKSNDGSWPGYDPGNVAAQHVACDHATARFLRQAASFPPHEARR